MMMADPRLLAAGAVIVAEVILARENALVPPGIRHTLAVPAGGVTDILSIRKCASVPYQFFRSEGKV